MSQLLLPRAVTSPASTVRAGSASAQKRLESGAKSLAPSHAHCCCCCLPACRLRTGAVLHHRAHMTWEYTPCEHLSPRPLTLPHTPAGCCGPRYIRMPHIISAAYRGSSVSLSRCSAQLYCVPERALCATRPADDAMFADLFNVSYSPCGGPSEETSVDYESVPTSAPSSTRTSSFAASMRTTST